MNITYKLKKLIKKLSLGDWRAKKRRQFRLLKIYWRKATTRGLKIRVISAYLRVSTDLLVVIVILGVMIAQPLILLLSSRHASAVKYVNYTTNLYPDGDSTRTWASFTDGNAGDGETCDATHHYFCVNEASTATSDYINTGTAGTTGETEDYTVQNPSLGPGTFDTTTAVRVKWHADTAACNGNAPNCDSVSVNIFINGALQTAQTTTMTTTATTYTTTFTGSWAAINDLRIVFVRNRVGGGSAASADDDLRLYQAYADVDYRMVVTSPKLAMTGYVWENDDSSAADTASQLAIGGTAVTVPIGSRMNLRAQIKNTGGGLDAEKLGLFYDNGSGQWSKVKSATKKNTTSSPDLTTIDSSTLTGQYSSVAIDTAGNPWISYQDTSNSELRVAQYVGSGGSGCASTAWTCLTVDSVSSVTGDSTSIGFNPSGVAYISYIDETAFDLRVAHYVGSGGSGCTSSAWTCESADTAVASTDIFNPSTSIAFGSTGNPWISYNFHNGGTLNEDLRVAQYVGSGGTGCGNTTWLCTNVHITGNSGSYSSIAVDDSGTAWVSFNILTSSDLAIAKYVGSGGSGCNSSAWTCTTIAATNLVGDYNSIAIDPAGNPWISYYDSSGNNLQIAKFVTSGGNCDTVAGGSDAWDCTTVDSTNLVGSYTSLAFDPAGNPWISYYDESGHNLRVARYDGDGTASGCADNAWTCTDIDTSNDVGSYSSLAFDPSGNAWISEYNATSSDLRVAEIVGGGEILMAPSERLSGGDAISESHSDMTALPDNTNRDDADCVGGGTWANGKYFESEEGSGLTMADGSGTAQCTEVMFTIDLSQAVVGTTYRFMIATNDGTKMFKGMWRGPISATAIPTLTVADISMIAAKDNNIRLPDCPTGSSSGWGCITVDDATDDTGRYSSIAFSPSGAPYASYYDATTLSLMVAQYVGSGGSGCGASGSSAWTCTKVDEDTDGTGQYSSLAFSPSGVPYASYYDSTATALMVAQYVGSGGTGCGASGSSAWTCTAVDNDTDDTGVDSSIAFSPSGVAYVSYYDNTVDGVMFAQYVGSGGTGCGASGSSAWTCTKVHDDTNNYGFYGSIAVSPSGIPYISYYDNTGTALVVAQYVGSGGTGCGASGSSAWTCTVVDNDTDDTGQQPSITFSPSGVPYVSYRDATATSLMVAQYVTSGGSGCGASGSSAWTCTVVDNDTDDTGIDSSIAFSPSGVPYVSYYDNTVTGLMFAKYVTSGGSGCGASGSSAWTCTVVDDETDDVGSQLSLAFSPSGEPYIGYVDFDSSSLKVAKLNRPNVALNLQNQYTNPGRNATGSDARYRQSLGRSASVKDGTCGGGTADYLGMCSLFQDNGDYDTISAQINESPYQTFAMRFSTNAELPTASWVGNTTLAPSTAGTTGDIKLEVYRYGSTNAWESVASDTATSDCSARCSLSGLPSGTASEYFNSSGGYYWVYFRLYQEASSSSAITFKTDQFKTATSAQKNRGGSYFQDGQRRPLNWR